MFEEEFQLEAEAFDERTKSMISHRIKRVCSIINELQNSNLCTEKILSKALRIHRTLGVVQIIVTNVRGKRLDTHDFVNFLVREELSSE